MKISELCSAPVVVTFPDQPLISAAHALVDHDVGALVVLERPGSRRPVGMLTDRDIVQAQYRRANLHCLTAGDAMTRDPLTLRADSSLAEGLAALASRGVRRAPVIDAQGMLVGIITFDDLLPAVSRKLSLLAGVAGTRSAISALGTTRMAAQEASRA